MKGWSGTGSDTFALKFKNCEELCPIEEFEKIVKPIIPSDDLLAELKASKAVYEISVIVY